MSLKSISSLKLRQSTAQNFVVKFCQNADVWFVLVITGPIHMKPKLAQSLTTSMHLKVLILSRHNSMMLVY